jgi:hypothetical protein
MLSHASLMSDRGKSMLVTCPRCGFEQPKDKFCAKCGIIMEGFVGKKPPLTSRIASSVTFYSLIVALVIGSFIFFYLSDRKKNQEEILAEATTETTAPSPEGKSATARPMTAATNNL